MDRAVPAHCPNCGLRWGNKDQNGPTPQYFVKEFADALAALSKAIAKASDVGFALTFEVCDPASSGKD